jgi:hypothetical protein
MPRRACRAVLPPGAAAAGTARLVARAQERRSSRSRRALACRSWAARILQTGAGTASLGQARGPERGLAGATGPAPGRLPSRSKSWCMRAKGARPTAWRAHGAPASPPPLTLDGAGVLQVADGRGVHHVPHDEALDGLVLGHHHARGLAADALDLRHDSVRNGLGEPHQPQERGLGRQAGPQGARGAHMAAPMLVAASVAPLLRHVRGVQRLLCTLGPVKTHDGSGAPQERVRLRKAAGDKQAFALQARIIFRHHTALARVFSRALHCDRSF